MPVGNLLDEKSFRALRERDERGLLRSRQTVVPIDATHIEVAGKRYINFASNDYLGLTHHPQIIEAVRRAAEKYGAGSGAAGLISGYTEEHAAAERDIAQWKQMQSAILLPSGYQANLAAIQTLTAIAESQKSEGVPASIRAEDRPAHPRNASIRFLVDQLAHASLIDAVRASGAVWRVFPHNHLAKLERLLREAPAGQMQIVISESIFSMDGNAADLPGIANLKSQIPFVLLLDEAHGTGVYGEAGSGYAEEMGLREMVDISIVTLSKAMGCVGGAICGNDSFVNAVANFGRAWIYSTNVPATVAAAAQAAIGVIREEPERQKRLRELAKRLRKALSISGPADSPIVPIVLGEEKAAMAASERLKQAGMWVVAVRPPTVKKGSSRLRVTISSQHTDAELNLLIQELKLTTDEHR